jgi:CheY-like chemotaxis protein
MKEPREPVVMVVDDDEDTREFVGTLLRSEGYSALCSKDAETAIDALAKTSSPALVLVDMHMPRMDGSTFVAQLRGLPHWSEVHVVLMSADHDCIAASDFETLPKPLDLSALLSVVRRHYPELRRRPGQRKSRRSSPSVDRTESGCS